MSVAYSQLQNTSVFASEVIGVNETETRGLLKLRFLESRFLDSWIFGLL